MKRCIGALDQGTTSTRFMVFDAAGAAVATCQREHRQIFPQPGWVEHDPLEIIIRSKEVITVALRSANINANELAAIGITNQRETTVVWNRVTGQPLYNAIVWQDTRTDRMAQRLAPQRELLVQRTGLPPSTYFSALKLQWILDHIEGARTAALRGEVLFGTIDSWLIWNLTGGVHGGRHVTDVTNASRTQLMNLDTLQWDAELLRLFNIPEQSLPRICPSSAAGAYGCMRIDELGTTEIPIGGNLGDQHAAVVGQTCFAPGTIKNTYGTGNFMLLNSGQRRVTSASGLLTTVAYQFEGSPAVYALEGSIAVTGAAVQWLRDQLGVIRSAVEIESLAASVPDSGGVYFVPAFSGLFAPYWRADARGAIVGLSRFHTKAHLARAALEAICFQTRAVADAMQRDSNVELNVLKVDGGASVNNLLMQMQADILGAPVVRPRVSETTALGAAYVAGLATGFWKDTQALSHHWQVDRDWTPCWSVDQRETAYRGWEKAVQRSLDWVERD